MSLAVPAAVPGLLRRPARGIDPHTREALALVDELAEIRARRAADDARRTVAARAFGVLVGDADLDALRRELDIEALADLGRQARHAA